MQLQSVQSVYVPSLFLIECFFPPLQEQQQQMAAKISKLQHEYQQLEASLKTYTGEDLSSLTSVAELGELEQQLESAVGKVRARKVVSLLVILIPGKYCFCKLKF